MVIVELPIFTEQVGEYLTDHEYSQVQYYLVTYPHMGVLVPGTQGLRKLRWSGAGKGKCGGLRIIYYWIVDDKEIVMVSIYRKADRDDLTPDQYRALRKELEDEG